VDEAPAYETPLGRVPVDVEAATALRAAHPRLAYRAEAHASGEHSLEVMLPFLQVALGEFSLVPVLMGNATLQDAEILAGALAGLAARGDYLFVFSTDLSHYHPDEQARAIDERTTGAILRETPQAVHRLFERQALEACGRGPIVTSLLLAAKLGHLQRELLGYANSGDTSGDHSKVVGYGAVAMVERPQGTADQLSPETGQALVTGARRMLRIGIGGRDGPDPAEELATLPELSRNTGIFVTLRKHGQLRGCIGRIEGVGALAKVCPIVAMDAALRDPRFRPVTVEELPELEVEVSVLSPPKKLERLEDLVPGRDGVILEHPHGHGVFLPQVWDETGWTREEFLSELASQKAGLPPDAWKTATLLTFQDQVFSEK
jgi:AmmeMemoRadiSam system protein A